MKKIDPWYSFSYCNPPGTKICEDLSKEFYGINNRKCFDAFIFLMKEFERICESEGLEKYHLHQMSKIFVKTFEPTIRDLLRPVHIKYNPEIKIEIRRALVSGKTSILGFQDGYIVIRKTKMKNNRKITTVCRFKLKIDKCLKAYRWHEEPDKAEPTKNLLPKPHNGKIKVE